MSTGKVAGTSVGAGLVNVGNYCFMNSVIQAAFHTPSIRQIVQSHCKVSCASELRVYIYQVWLAFIHLGGTLSQFCALYCLKDLLAQHTPAPGNAVSLFQNLNCKICTYHSQYIHNVHNTQV